MRSFSLVLLRRLLFRPSTNQRVALYDHLGAQAIATLQRILLHSLLHEPAAVVRRKTVDTVTDLLNNAMKRGHPWPALQPQVFAMADNPDVLTREAAFRVFAGCPNLIIDLHSDAVLALLQKGLQDPQNTEVSIYTSRLSAPSRSINPPVAHVFHLIRPHSPILGRFVTTPISPLSVLSSSTRALYLLARPSYSIANARAALAKLPRLRQTPLSAFLSAFARMSARAFARLSFGSFHTPGYHTVFLCYASVELL